MEPVKESHGNEVVYKFTTCVRSVQEIKTKEWVSGHGDSATFTEISRGWFVNYEGSQEQLCLGKEMPDWKVGDKVEITMRRKK